MASPDSVQTKLLDARDKAAAAASDVQHAVHVDVMSPDMAPLYYPGFLVPAVAKTGALTSAVRQMAPPAGTQIVIEETEDTLDIRLPRFSVSSRFVLLYAVSVVYLVFLMAIFLSMPPMMRPLELVVALACAVVALLLSFGVFACTRERVSFSRDAFSVVRTLDLPLACCHGGSSLGAPASTSLPLRQLHSRAGRVADIIHVNIVLAGFQYHGGLSACQLVEGVRAHRFGRGLSAAEQQWLVQRIAGFLRCPYSMAVALA